MTLLLLYTYLIWHWHMAITFSVIPDVVRYCIVCKHGFQGQR